MWNEASRRAYRAHPAHRIGRTAGRLLVVAACVSFVIGSSAARTIASDVPLFTPPTRVAVFPPIDEAHDPARADEIHGRIRDGFIAHGFLVTDDDVLERFFERHRVRWLGGVTPAIAAAARSEIGVDAVIVTSILRVDDASPPAISLAVRWVDIADDPRILWMEVVTLHGRDQLGLLGQKEVRRIEPLLSEALSGVFVSLEEDFIATKRLTDPAASVRRYAPRAWASAKDEALLAVAGTRVAVLPFRADGASRTAASILENLFLRHLSKIPDIHVIDPGVVRDTLLGARIIMSEGPSLDQADIIGSLASADLEITGSVRTYVSTSGVDSVPFVEFWTVGLEPSGRQSVWSSFSSNRGTDGVFFFRAGIVSSAEELAFEMSRAIVHRWVDAP